jgi:predicted RNA-binding protein with PUA-like domain
MTHWLVKSEPEVYSFTDLQRDGRTRWDGVRNFTARNNLRAMAVGDTVLFYHSNVGKEIVGIARVARAAYPDPSAPDWSAVDLEPVKALVQPVTLAQAKADPALADMQLVRFSRLSVTQVSAAELKHVLKLSRTKVA